MYCSKAYVFHISVKKKGLNEIDMRLSFMAQCRSKFVLDHKLLLKFILPICINDLLNHSGIFEITEKIQL